jgi:hypothetical protein
MHTGGISSESSPGCLVGFAVRAPVELHAEVQLAARRMNNKMLHILFMIFLVRQPSASAVGRGTFSLLL